MLDKIRRKEIYLADLGRTAGSEEKGVRPVLIVQNDLGNKYSPTTIIVPITRRIEGEYKIPTHIQVEPFGKMLYKATILAEQIKVIDKQRLKYYIEELPNEYMKKVDYAMTVAIGINEERINEDGVWRYRIYRLWT